MKGLMHSIFSEAHMFPDQSYELLNKCGGIVTARDSQRLLSLVSDEILAHFFSMSIYAYIS